MPLLCANHRRVRVASLYPSRSPKSCVARISVGRANSEYEAAEFQVSVPQLQLKHQRSYARSKVVGQSALPLPSALLTSTGPSLHLPIE